MRKCILFLILSTFIAPKVWSQWSVGINAGFGKNYLKTGNDGIQFSKLEPVNSYSFGIPVKYNFNNWFAIQSGLHTIRKGYEVKRTGFFENVYHQNIQQYIQLPIEASFSFGGNKLKGYLNLGAYSGYWVSGKVKGRLNDFFNLDHTEAAFITDLNEVNYNENYDFVKERDNRIDFGFSSGLGTKYTFNPQYEIFVEAKYYRSMLDIQKKYMENQLTRFNDTFLIQFGVFYNFQKNK